MGDYPNKIHIGLTDEQKANLEAAIEKTGKSKTFLVRKYIENGANEDLSPSDSAHNPTTE